MGNAAPVAAPRTAGWAELKPATILFADIVSSTEQIDGLDPEQAMGRLRPAIAQMCRTIESFGGTVVRTLGDGIMAIFGAPRTLEGHARLACQAALTLQGVFQRESESQGFSIRVGLHSGQVAADPLIADGVIGPDVYGHAIHLASRIVGLAEPSGVCITSATLALIRHECEVREMGFHRLKGIAEPVETHVLLRIRSELDSLQFHLPSLSFFRGREQEFAMLQAGVQRAASGQGMVIGVCGVPGAGKSRLCNELARWCREQQMTVYKVRTEPYGHAAPLQSMLALMRTCFFEISAADDAATTRKRIADRLAALGPVVDEDQSLLNEFFSVAEEGSAPCTLNPRARRTRLLELVRALAQNAGQQVSVILFEDLHWLDEASEEFLAALVEATASAHLLLLLNYRPGYKAPWRQLSHFQQLDLAELSSEDIGLLVTELLASRSDLQDAIPLIVERAAGNPFFAEELAHSLADGTPLPAGDGPQRLAAIAQALPPTVQAVIGERIDRLVSSRKAVLHICAVIGKEVPQALLQRVAVSLASQLERELDGLCEAELLLLLREMASGRRFAFRHPLIQEVAYSAQLKTRRADLHAAVAAAMEVFYQARPDEYAALIAFHYESSGQLASAARYEARAAQWIGATDSAQGIARWRKVRALLLNVPRTEQTDSLRALACGRIVYLGWREGLDYEEGQILVREAMDLASDGQNRLTPLLLFVQGRLVQSGGGAADVYVDNLQKALSFPDVMADKGRTAALNLALSHAFGWSGLMHEALAANDIAMHELESIDKFESDFIGFSLELWALCIRVRSLNRMERFGDATTYLDMTPEIAKSVDDPVMQQIAHWMYVDLAWCTGDAALGKVHAAKVAEIGEKNKTPYSQVLMEYCRGLSQFTERDFEGAVKTFLDAIEFVRRTRVAFDIETEIAAGLAESYQYLGDFERALHAGNEVVRLARLRSNRLAECRGFIVLGAVRASDTMFQNHDEATVFFDEAEKLVKITGASIFEKFLAQARTPGSSVNIYWSPPPIQ